MQGFCDYLSFTVDYTEKNLSDIFLFFGAKMRDGKGIHGYSTSFWTHYEVLIAYTIGKPEHKIFVSASSDALKNLGEFKKLDYFQIIEWSKERNPHVTRIDLAIDDFTHILNLDTISEKLKKGHIASRLKTWTEYIGHFQNSEIRSHKIKNSQKIGRTLYIGDLKHGSVVFRFYDKAAEQGENFHWIRCELQLREEAANQFVFPCNYEELYDFQTGEKIPGKKDKKPRMIKEKIEEKEISRPMTLLDRTIPGTFYYYLRFLEPTFLNRKRYLKTKDILGIDVYYPEYQEKKRWSTSDFWLTFLNYPKPQEIGLPKYKGDLDDLLSYWKKSMAGLNFLLQKVSNEKLEAILKKEGEAMYLKNPHYKRIAENESLKSFNF